MQAIRTLNTVDRSVQDSGLLVVDVPARQAVDVIGDTTLALGEIAYIELFNAGNDKAYFAYGKQADNQYNFSGWIVPGQAMTVIVRQRVSVFSEGGTRIARTVMRRVDQLTAVQ